MGRRGFCWALFAATLSAAPQREAAEVLCSNTTDCTEVIQAALDDPTQRHVVLPTAGSGLRHCRSPVGNKLAVTCHVSAKTDDAEVEQLDILVFGATPAGIAAAVAARRTSPSLRVALVEPSRWIGGMMAGGLGCT